MPGHMPANAKHELFYKTRERSPWRSWGIFDSRAAAKDAVARIPGSAGNIINRAILVKILSCEA